MIYTMLDFADSKIFISIKGKWEMVCFLHECDEVGVRWANGNKATDNLSCRYLEDEGVYFCGFVNAITPNRMTGPWHEFIFKSDSLNYTHLKLPVVEYSYLSKGKFYQIRLPNKN